jgi:hypothetical protein
MRTAQKGADTPHVATYPRLRPSTPTSRVVLAAANDPSGARETISQLSRADRYPQALRAASESPQTGSEPSTSAECRRSIAATSLGVAGRTEGHPNAFSKHTNCFSSPSARGTRSSLDRRKPPRKCRLKECFPGETWYTLICLGEMAPTFELSRKTLTTPPSPIAGLRR